MFFIPTENVLISKLSSCLDIFDPVSDVEEFKKKREKEAAEIEERKAHKTSEAFWRVFRAPWREKRKRAGTGA